MKHKNTAYISRAALCSNYAAIDALVSDNASRSRSAGGRKPRIICVVKADGYGHGIHTVAGALGDAGCGRSKRATAGTPTSSSSGTSCRRTSAK